MYSHFLKIHKRARRVIVMLNLAFVYFFGSAFPVHAASDFVTVELRVDLLSVNQARDYIHKLYVGGKPTTGSDSDYTAAWFSVNLADGGANGRKFTQVGFLTDKTNVKWFVYSGAGVECWRGKEGWGNLGCVGAEGDLATIGHWQNVELVTYPGDGFWIARVYDQNGAANDVAKILYDSSRIYRATAVTEEAYPEATDPFIRASFWHNHPKYMVWGTGFQNWPASSGGHNNRLFTSPTTICPNHYIAKINLNGDPRIWYAGSAGPTPATCSANPIF